MSESVNLLEKKFYQLLSEDKLMQDFLDDEAFAGIWFWDLKDRSNIWLSKSLKKLLGFNIDYQIQIPKSWKELLPLTELENICATFDAYLDSENDEQFVIDIPFLNNHHHAISLHCRAIAVDHQSYLLGLVQLNYHQTDKRTDKISTFDFNKKAHCSKSNQLENLECQGYASKYESLIIAGNLGGWEYNVATQELWCSKEYFDLLGYDTKEIRSWEKYDLQKVWIDQLHPDDIENADDYFNQYLRNLKGVLRHNFRMKHADGRWVWISSRGKASTEIIDGVTKQIIIGTHTDISESKRLEEELNNSNKVVLQDNALLKSIINSPEDIFIVSIDTNYHYTSFSNAYKCFVKMNFGKDISIGYCILNIFSDQQLSVFKSAMDTALGGEHCQVCFTIPLMDGKTIFLENRYNPIQDEFGNVTGATIFIQDITKVKNTETANRINELRYSSLFTASSDAIFIANVKTGIIVDVNPKACDLLGYEKSELIGMHQSMLHPIEDLKFIKQKFKELTSNDNDTLQSVESYIQHKNGKRIPISINASSPFQIGEDIFSAAYFKDLTKAKEIEGNASNLLELLKTAEMLSTTGSVEFDLVSKKIIWSDEFFKILGYAPQSFELNKDSLYNHIHAEDRDDFIQWQESAMKSVGQSETVDFRILKNDGSISLLRTSGISFADLNGTIYKFIAVAKDITIKSRISLELNMQNQRLKEIAWTQSHLFRAPLTRLMGLVQVLQKGIVPDDEKGTYFNYVVDSANELDHVIKEITAKTIS